MDLNGVLDVVRERHNSHGVHKSPSILLLSAPGFAQGWSPLGIARLKSFLRARGYGADALPLCVLFTNYLRRRTPYLLRLDAQIAEFGTTWHELFYSAMLFGHAPPEELIRQSVQDQHANVDIYRTYLDYRGGLRREPKPQSVAADVRRVRRFCALLHSFLCDVLETVDWAAYDAIGFSCLDTQFLTSLYLAREIRRRHDPGPLMIFGGEFFQSYNAAQVLEDFAEIDYLVVGQAEETLADLLARTKNRDGWPRLSGTMPDRGAYRYRRDGTDRIDLFPPPDYTELQRCRGTKYALTIGLGAGCSNSGCSFCSIGSTGQHLRPAAKVVEEIRSLYAVHGKREVDFVDWEINGDPRYLEELCDLVVKNRLKLTSWGEVNARNTSPLLLAKMRAAGIRCVQVGIESFSADTLRLIGKRATLVDNVKILKWGIEARLDVVLFNILCNHPLTTVADPAENLRVMRLIGHLLRPPVCLILNEVSLYRTSRLHRQAERFRLGRIREFDFYRRLYPPTRLPREVPMFCLAFDALPVASAWKKVDTFLKKLKRSPVTLTARKGKSGSTIIHDTRSFRKYRYRLNALEADVLWEAMDHAPSLNAIAARFGEPVESVAAAVRRLVRRKLVIQSDDQVLSLPLKAGAPCGTPTSGRS